MEPKTHFVSEDILILVLLGLEVAVSGGMAALVIAFMTCFRRDRQLARRDFAMLLTHSMFLTFAVFYLVLSTNIFHPDDIKLCRQLEATISFSWIVLCTVILYIYYLRVEVLFGPFYPKWYKRPCVILLGFGFLSIPYVLKGIRNTFISDGGMCLFGNYDEVVFFELMVSKAIPSSIFLILLLIPLLSCSRAEDSSPVAQVMRKQFLITALDILVDFITSIIIWNADQLTSTCVYLVGACLQNILLALVFVDWRRRVFPWRKFERRSKKSSFEAVRMAKISLDKDDLSTIITLSDDDDSELW